MVRPEPGGGVRLKGLHFFFYDRPHRAPGATTNTKTRIMATSVLAVKIPKSTAQGKSIPVAVSSAWKISFPNAKKVNTIVAVRDRKVIGVFSVGSPSLIRGAINHGRVQFDKVCKMDNSLCAHNQTLDSFTFCGPLKFI